MSLKINFFHFLTTDSFYVDKKPDVDFPAKSHLFVRKIRRSVFDVGVSDYPNF